MNILFDKNSVGLETVNGEQRFHCIAILDDKGTVVAKRLIQGCVDYADLKAKAEAAFEGEVKPDPVPVDDAEKIAQIKASISDVPIVKTLAEIG
jgi:hypothetical protein